MSQGESVRNKIILVAAEGGFGDEILNVRFARILEERGGKVIWLTKRPSLKTLLARAPGVADVITHDQLINLSYDVWIPALDLPFVLNLDAHEIPNSSYLAAKNDLIEFWRTRLLPSPHLRVGVRWQCHAGGPEDAFRVLPFSALETLTKLDNISFYSLHHGEGQEQLPDHSLVEDWGARFKSFEDTAAALSHLDIIITTDTAVAHLAGALGKTAWILSAPQSYYVWNAPHDQSVWHPRATLIRQDQLGSWDKPIEIVRIMLLEARADPKLSVR